jgi:hypothetical protein
MFATKTVSSSAEKYEFLNCRRLPARLNTSEVALVLGFQEHDIATLTAAKLLMPLGKPAPNAPKYFATVDITAAAADREWLAAATRVIAKRWRDKNNRRNGFEVLSSA